MGTGLIINNIDFSDESGVDELTFSIEHDNMSPSCLWLNIHKKSSEDNSDITLTLEACQMKALGKALVFAGEYVEGLFSKDGFNF